MTTIQLKKPVKVGDVEFASVEIDEPSIGAVEAYQTAIEAKESDLVAMLKMLAAEFDWPLAAVRKLRSSDVEKITDAMLPFVTAPGNTGASSPPT
jgi:hypothetical protein